MIEKSPSPKLCSANLSGLKHQQLQGTEGRFQPGQLTLICISQSGGVLDFGLQCGSVLQQSSLLLHQALA